MIPILFFYIPGWCSSHNFYVSLQLKNKKFNKHIKHNKHYGKEKKIFSGRRGHPSLLV